MDNYFTTFLFAWVIGYFAFISPHIYISKPKDNTFKHDLVYDNMLRNMARTCQLSSYIALLTMVIMAVSDFMSHYYKYVSIIFDNDFARVLIDTILVELKLLKIISFALIIISCLQILRWVKNSISEALA